MIDFLRHENTQYGAFFKDVKVTGGESSVFSIGNTTQNTYLQQKPEFFEPNLEQFELPNFVSPSQDIIREFVEIIKEKTILVLGGGNDLDKISLARYLAWYLRNSSGGKRPILEWQRSSDPQSIDVELQKAEKPTIFILNQVSPQNVGYNLTRIQKVATFRGHYVVVSTDTPLPSWKLSAEEKVFLRDLSSDEIYNFCGLIKVLFQELNNAGKSLIQALDPELLQAIKNWGSDETFLNNERNFNQIKDINFTESLKVSTVVKELKLPDNIARFVQILTKEIDTEKGSIKETTVRELLKKNQDNQSTLNQWYHHILNPREQLLALGLNFFDGLLDDQFFTALEEVVENVWQKRDPDLRALDYCDLDNLLNFFNLNPIGIEVDEKRVEGCFPQQRRMLFKVAWESHRRQIIAALTTIEKLVKNSVANRSFNQELYGTSARRKQLRRVLSEALSDIGWISATAVQDTLRQLAADEEIGVQAVAAYAMGRWRDPNYGRDKELFETLHNWQNDERIISQFKSLLKNQDEEQSKEPQDYIRATIALTVSYAALYDPPNELHPKLYDLLKKLSEDPNRLVRDRFCSHTLPLVIPLHLVQLRDMLHDMTQKTDLIPAISASLAIAYRGASEEVRRTLDLWHNEYSQNQSRRINKKITLRETLLATIALTYGQIQYDASTGTLTSSKAFGRLQQILKGERHPFVRNAVLIAIRILANQYFRQIEEQLQELVSEVSFSERNEIVEILAETYLKQRESLEGGDDEIKVNSHHYRVWIGSNQRPKTDVELAMFRWIKDDTKAVAQQVATDAEVKFFDVLDQEEERRIRAIRKQRSEQEIVPAEIWEPPIINGQSQPGLYLGKLVPWLATRNKERYRPAISNLLSKAFKHHQFYRNAMDFVLGKWSRAQDNEVSTISTILKSGLWWAETLPLLVAGGGALLILTGVLAVNVIQTNISLPPSPTNTPIPLGLTKEQAVNRINEYLQVKAQIFAPPYDRELVAKFTTGKYYEEITKPGGRIDELKQKNQYYRYLSRQTEPIGYFSNKGNLVEIDLKINEMMHLYEKDIYKEDKSYAGIYRFTLQKENGDWKIANRVKIDS